MAEPTDEQLREAERQLSSNIIELSLQARYDDLVRERALRIAERAEHAAAIAELVAALELAVPHVPHWYGDTQDDDRDVIDAVLAKHSKK